MSLDVLTHLVGQCVIVLWLTRLPGDASGFHVCLKRKTSLVLRTGPWSHQFQYAQLSKNMF